MNQLNVRQFGAKGDGITDDTEAIQKALDSGSSRTVFIPEGVYRITSTLQVSSDTSIVADSSARLFHCGSLPKKRGDFLLSNRDTVNGNSNISISGGIWDGNFDGINNTKNPDLFDQNACSGATINFQNVTGLTLSDMTIANSVVYFTRLCQVRDFRISDIRFRADKPAFNQDGLHFGGGCRDGEVSNVRAVTYGQTNDDLIALNADDSIVRLENLDLVRDDIENITFRDLYAENCHTLIRMLSVTSAIRNIRIENAYGGCRTYAINADAARYCRTPLFKDDEYPDGVGCIENISIDNMKIYSTNPSQTCALIDIESHCDNFTITNLERVAEKDMNPSLPLLEAKNITNTLVEYTQDDENIEIEITKKSDRVIIDRPADSIRINRKKRIKLTVTRNII